MLLGKSLCAVFFMTYYNLLMTKLCYAPYLDGNIARVIGITVITQIWYMSWNLLGNFNLSDYQTAFCEEVGVEIKIVNREIALLGANLKPHIGLKKQCCRDFF